MNDQHQLDDFSSSAEAGGDEQSRDEGGSPDAPSAKSGAYFHGLAPDATMDAESCPWCLCPADRFVRKDSGVVGCGHCDAVIPTGAGWYRAGDKIVM